jgi:hypothetical protein
MGIECGRKRDVAEVRALGWGKSESEPGNRVVRKWCRVVRKDVKPRVALGGDTNRRDAAKHANFSKWDRDFMLRAEAPWVESEVGSQRRLISR